MLRTAARRSTFGHGAGQECSQPRERRQADGILASDKAQQLYAEANFEYPVKAGVPVSEVTQSFGELKPDTLPIAEMAKHRKEASEMVDRVGLDAGPSS
jgi:hypothetical protein